MNAGRVIYFDILNVVAAFGVVAMHFNGLVHAYMPTWDWVQALAADCLFYWAVPVFFMLSGATLMDYRDRYTTKEFLLRRARRTLVPFLAWSVIALVWKVGTGQMPLPQGPMTLISLIFNTQIIDIYWFFIPLFAVYLALPVLSLLRENKRALWYLAALGVLLNVALPFLCSVAGIMWNASASFPLLGGYLLYVLLGYLLRDAELDSSKRRFIYIVGLAGVLVRFVHTALASRASGELVQLTWGYTSLPCFLEAMAVFVFARQVKWGRFFRSDRSREALSRVAGCSFGVYLIHMIVFWFGLVLSEYDGGDYEWRLIGPIVAYVVSLTIVAAMKRVPVVSLLVP